MGETSRISSPPVASIWISYVPQFCISRQAVPKCDRLHDGDEILYVISGKVLGTGQACIVPKGEWHRVDVLETTQLLYITPGPNGDHRSLAS